MTRNDKLTVSYFNNIVSQINLLCQELDVPLLGISKDNGDFLFAEDINTIENKLEALCYKILINHNKKSWFNLSTLSYLDINRWENTINEIIRELDNSNKGLYPRNNLYPRASLYSFKKGV